MPKLRQHELRIERILNVPPEKLWKIWTQPEHFKNWWGIESTLIHCEMDVRPGGTYLLCMETLEHEHHWYTGTYQRVEPNRLLEYTDSFADETGRITPASHYGFSESFPLVMIVTVQFEDTDGKTKLTLTQSGLPDKGILSQTRTGWNISLANLGEYLDGMTISNN